MPGTAASAIGTRRVQVGAESVGFVILDDRPRVPRCPALPFFQGFLSRPK